MNVTAEDLLRGMWFTLESCGEGLRAAADLFQGGHYAKSVDITRAIFNTDEISGDKGDVFMKTILVLLALIVTLASPGLAAQVDADHLIQPGVGIGSVRIGMNIQDAIKVWGPPRAIRELELRTTGYTWALSVEHGDGTATITQGGPAVVADATGSIVAMIAFYDGTFQTAEGVHTSTAAPSGRFASFGSTEKEVRRLLGEPDTITQRPHGVTQWGYNSGLILDFERVGIGAYVSQILVVRKAV